MENLKNISILNNYLLIEKEKKEGEILLINDTKNESVGVVKLLGNDVDIKINVFVGDKIHYFKTENTIEINGVKYDLIYTEQIRYAINK